MMLINDDDDDDDSDYDDNDVNNDISDTDSSYHKIIYTIFSYWNPSCWSRLFLIFLNFKTKGNHI